MAKIGLLINLKQSVINKEIEALKRKAGNLSPVLEPIAAEMTRRVRARFNTKTDPDGRKWKPWAASTAEAYASGKKKRTLMLNTKELRDKTIVVATKRGFRMRMGTKYGRYHEQVEGNPRKIPRRAFFFSAREKRRLSEKDERYILNEVSKQLLGKRFTKKLRG